MKQFLLVAIAAFSIPLFAQTYAGFTDEDCRETEDQYETPTRISDGSKSFAGGCIDTDRFRPPVLIEDTDSVFKFANYKHLGKYWIAEVPKSAPIDKTFFHIVRFDVVSGITAAHTQFRVRYKEDAIRLTPQDGQGDSISINDIVVSYEASRPKNNPYNFALGAVDNYLLVGRVLSGRQRQDESTENTTEQYEMILNQAEASQLLYDSLIDSKDIVFKGFYNTLNPNCTTQIFHRIDELPSVKAKNPQPFLTVISNNPIAAPSLKALEQRGILGPEYATLYDEMDRDIHTAPDGGSSSSSLNLLAEVEGYPYSIVFAADSQADSKEIVEKGKAVAYQLAPQIAQRLAASLMLSAASDDFSLLGTLKDLAPSMRASLDSINSQLTDEMSYVSLYLTPWNGSGTRVNVMETLDVPARLPFESYDSTYSDIAFSEGLYEAMDANKNSGQPFHLLSVAVHLALQKDNSALQIQVYGQLNPQSKELVASNDKIDIHTFEVPETPSHLNPPSMVLNLTQKANEELPTLRAEFGPYGLTQSGVDQGFAGRILIADQDCEMQTQATPRLLGKATLLGVLKWKSAALQITAADFDLESLDVEKLDVKVRSFPVDCLASEDIDSQFTDAVNAEIGKLKDSAAEQGQSAGLSLLNKLLGNNEEGVIPGFANQ